MRSGPGTDSAGSIASSVSLNSPKDFHEVKELVKDIQRRLAVLEKVFVFVDLDQINQVITSFGARSALHGKDGTDSTLSSLKPDAAPAANPAIAQVADWADTANPSTPVSDGMRDFRTACGDWQCLPDGFATPGMPSRPNLIGSSTTKSPYPPLQVGRPRLQPLEPPKSMHSTTCLMPPSKLLPSTTGLLRDSADKTGITACTLDSIDDVPSSAGDAEKSLRSTGSTTAFTSTCDGEEDIEPERCNHFMKQALQSAKAKQTWIDKVNRMREKTTIDPPRISDRPR
jgi:hypothetical protein